MSLRRCNIVSQFGQKKLQKFLKPYGWWLTLKSTLKNNLKDASTFSVFIRGLFKGAIIIIIITIIIIIIITIIIIIIINDVLFQLGL